MAAGSRVSLSPGDSARSALSQQQGGLPCAGATAILDAAASDNARTVAVYAPSPPSNTLSGFSGAGKAGQRGFLDQGKNFGPYHLYYIGCCGRPLALPLPASSGRRTAAALQQPHSSGHTLVVVLQRHPFWIFIYINRSKFRPSEMPIVWSKFRPAKHFKNIWTLGHHLKSVFWGIDLDMQTTYLTAPARGGRGR